MDHMDTPDHYPDRKAPTTRRNLLAAGAAGAAGVLAASSMATPRAAAVSGRPVILDEEFIASGSAGTIVAAIDSPQSWKDIATYQCDGVDDHVQINAAIAAAQPLQGVVTLAPTIAGYSTRAPVNIVGRVQLRGGGGWGRTVIKAASGHSAVGVDTSGVVIFTDPPGQPYDNGSLRDVTIHGGSLDVHGFRSRLLQTGPEKDDSNHGGSPDTQFTIEYVQVVNCGRSGVNVDFASGSASTSWHIDHVFVFSCGDSGAYAGIRVAGTDCWIANCNVGSQGATSATNAIGFDLAGSDNQGANLIAWVTKGTGFRVAGAKWTLTNAISHHSMVHGFEITGNRNDLWNCIAYNNAQDGFRLSANNCTITGRSFDDGDSFSVPGRPQNNGINLTQSTARGHRVILTTFGSGLVPVAGPGAAGSDCNWIEVIHTGNNQDGSTGTRSHTLVMDGKARTLPRSGAGSPEGNVAAPVGSLYTRTDGAAGTTLYVKESGVGSTGWVGK